MALHHSLPGDVGHYSPLFLGSSVLAGTLSVEALNQTILGGKWVVIEWYQSLISNWKCASEDVGPQGEWTVVSHIARGVNGEKPYMEGFHNTLSKSFLEKTRKILAQKIDQLNSAIDDVSSQLRSEDSPDEADDAPNGAAINSDEMEAAI
ncbi:hypothetical protein CK203_071341 [Vitis vinifera]|uniref:Uncharacterized protein n=1 Tax=Vitis vinifera TaxID=29760 RepID=A0A438ESY7_VITVI|nr:hypothetical protein CK203_071341 [Vitis vinifera]